MPWTYPIKKKNNFGNSSDSRVSYIFYTMQLNETHGTRIQAVHCHNCHTRQNIKEHNMNTHGTDFVRLTWHNTRSIANSTCTCSTTKARFPLPELTARVDGWLVSITRQHGPCWRVTETSHPSTRAVNSGSGNRALAKSRLKTINAIRHICSLCTEALSALEVARESTITYLLTYYLNRGVRMCSVTVVWWVLSSRRQTSAQQYFTGQQHTTHNAGMFRFWQQWRTLE